MEKAQRSLCIRRLESGGLITTYRCTSRCRHCLYGCSPEWPRDSIDDDTALASLETIRRLGCRAIHVGGGEPFLDPAALGRVLELAGGKAGRQEAGIWRLVPAHPSDGLGLRKGDDGDALPEEPFGHAKGVGWVDERVPGVTVRPVPSE